MNETKEVATCYAHNLDIKTALADRLAAIRCGGPPAPTMDVYERSEAFRAALRDRWSLCFWPRAVGPGQPGRDAVRSDRRFRDRHPYSGPGDPAGLEWKPTPRPRGCGGVGFGNSDSQTSHRASVGTTG